jgi:hypothetical protein
MYSVNGEQLELWKKSAEPVVKQWTDSVRKVGANPDTVLNELKTALAQHKAGM